MRSKLGQHFLINRQAVKKIISALDLQPKDTVIEIGPGKGALTFPLLEECKKIARLPAGAGCEIIGIEKDPKLIKELRNKMYELRLDNFEILEGDALKILTSYFLHLNSYKIVGNIPYYITGKLLRILSELENKPALIILMIQKEVAERIMAKPSKMNLLAAAIQFWAEPKILFTLKPNDFNPPPEVNSATILLTPKPLTLNPDIYYKLIHIIFKQPRKTLINNLKKGLNLPKNNIESALKSLKIDPNSRPQNLSLKEINSLAILLS